MGLGQLLGRAYVEIFGDSSKLQKSLQEVQSETEKTIQKLSGMATSGAKQGFDQTAFALNELKEKLKIARAEVISLEKEFNIFNALGKNPAVQQNLNLVSEKLQAAKIKVVELETAMKGLKATTQSTSRSGINLTSLYERLGLRLLGYYAIYKGLAFLKNAIEDAAAIEGVRTAFDKLDSPNLLQNLRKATRGAVADIDLMKAAVQAENFNISPELLIKGLELAGKTARQTGLDVNYLTESFIKGVGRKSPRILDNLQISLVDIQTEFKKTGNFSIAIGNIVDERLKKMGNVAETAADKIGKLGSSFKNFTTKVGELIQPVTNFIVDKLTTALNDLQFRIDNINRATGKMSQQEYDSKYRPSPKPIYNTLFTPPAIIPGVIRFDETQKTTPIVKNKEMTSQEISLRLDAIKQEVDLARLEDKFKGDIVIKEKQALEYLLKQATLDSDRIKILNELKSIKSDTIKPEETAKKEKERITKELYDKLGYESQNYTKRLKEDLNKQLADFKKTHQDETDIALFKAKIEKQNADDLQKFNDDNLRMVAKIIQDKEEYRKLVKDGGTIELKNNIGIIDLLIKQTKNLETINELLKVRKSLEEDLNKTGVFGSGQMQKVEVPGGADFNDPTVHNPEQRRIENLRKQTQILTSDELNKKIRELNSSLSITDNLSGMVATGFERAGTQLSSVLSSSIHLFGQANSLLQQFLQTLIQVTVQLLIMKGIEAALNFILPGSGSLAMAAGASSAVGTGVDIPVQTTSPNNQMLSRLNDVNGSIQAMNMNMINNSDKVPIVIIQSSDPSLRVKHDIGIKNNLEKSGMKSDLIRTIK